MIHTKLRPQTPFKHPSGIHNVKRHQSTCKKANIKSEPKITFSAWPRSWKTSVFGSYMYLYHTYGKEYCSSSGSCNNNNPIIPNLHGMKQMPRVICNKCQWTQKMCVCIKFAHIHYIYSCWHTWTGHGSYEVRRDPGRTSCDKNGSNVTIVFYMYLKEFCDGEYRGTL